MTPLLDSLAHTWPPFVLVVGLLLIGHAAARENVFAWLGEKCSLLRGPDALVFAAVMVISALVCATLNLDTAVVFMTPVAIETARRRGGDVVMFAYASAMMANAASTLLLGSNLTNLLVASPEGVTGSALTRAFALPWIASVALTILIALTWRGRSHHSVRVRNSGDPVRLQWGPGMVGTLGAIIAVLAIAQPALVVLSLGLGVEIVDSARRRSALDIPRLWKVANPALLAPLFAFAVGVGWLGRVWSGPAHWLGHATVLQTVVATSLGSVVINNLPAASLIAGHHVAHPFAALIGLDLGPNLFVTGALSSLLWWRIATSHGLRPTLGRLTALGVVTGALTITAATALVG